MTIRHRSTLDKDAVISLVLNNPPPPSAPHLRLYSVPTSVTEE